MKFRFLAALLICMAFSTMLMAKSYWCSSHTEKEENYYFNPYDFSPNDTVGYNRNNAMIMARLSNIVYEDNHTIKKIFDEINFRYHARVTYKFYNDWAQSTEYMFVNINRHLIICFRGSEFPDKYAGWKDWVGSDRVFEHYNLVYYNGNRENKYNLPDGQRGYRKRTLQLIEKGFFSRMEQFAIASQINIHQSTVFITGHSLGAALAQYILQPLMTHDRNIVLGGLYLFATPLTIACHDACNIEARYGTRIHNIVYERDVVARAKLRGRTATIGYYYRSVGGTVNRTEKQYINARWDFVNTITSYHPLSSYIKAVSNKWNTSEAVFKLRPYPIGTNPSRLYYYPGDDDPYPALSPEDAAGKCHCPTNAKFDPPLSDDDGRRWKRAD